jgi:L-asparaginase II
MPTQLHSSDLPILVEVTRTDRREAVHTVHAVCSDDTGAIIGHFGDPHFESYYRSGAKPFQLLTALTLRPSLLDECSDEELAVMAASHSGEPKHLETIQRIMDRYGLNEGLLKCGKHDPYSARANWEYGRIDRPITAIHCNCSGKHVGMLLACQAQGWPLEAYVQPDHPIQIANTQTLARHIGRAPETIEYGVDGCDVPTWWLPISEIATALARFGSTRFPHTEFESRAIARIFDVYHNAAWFTSGTGRFGVPFNKESDGKWLGKIGGEGVYGVSFRDIGLGIVIKAIDGNSRAFGPSLLYAMRSWDLIEGDQLRRLSGWVESVRRNSVEREIGVVRVVPGSCEL